MVKVLERLSLRSVRRPIGDNMLVSEIVSLSHLFWLHYSVYISPKVLPHHHDSHQFDGGDCVQKVFYLFLSSTS